MKPLIVMFEDPATHDRLSIVLEELGPGRWQTFAEFRRMPKGHRLRGATYVHYREREAHAAWKLLERQALARGWQYKQVVVAATAPAPIQIVGGQRLFRDARTGELISDGSSSRPLALARDPKPAVPDDAFNYDTLPIAR